jgi:hypothetical protein
MFFWGLGKECVWSFISGFKSGCMFTVPVDMLFLFIFPLIKTGYRALRRKN